MTAHELLARLIDAIPPPDCVVPVTFIEDAGLPLALAPVEPSAFALACRRALWGAEDGSLN